MPAEKTFEELFNETDGELDNNASFEELFKQYPRPQEERDDNASFEELFKQYPRSKTKFNFSFAPSSRGVIAENARAVGEGPRSPEEALDKGELGRAIGLSAASIPIRFAKELPSAIGRAARELASQPAKISTGLESLFGAEPGSVSKFLDSGPYIPGSELLKLSYAITPEEELSAAREEAKKTLGASVLRDAAFTGLTALSPPIGIPLSIGIPAAVEAGAKATGLEGALDELGGRVESVIAGEKPGPVREALAGIAGETVKHAPELGFLAAGLKRPLPEPEKVSPSIPGADTAAIQNKAVQKSIERHRAKVEGRKRFGIKPEEPLGVEQEVAPSFKEAVAKFINDPFGPGGEALSRFSGLQALKAGAKKVAEIILPKEKFNKFVEYFTPVKDNLPQEIRNALEEYERTSKLGLEQATALVNKIAQELPAHQKVFLRNILEELPRKPLPISKYTAEERPAIIGGPKGPLRATPENVRDRYSYYLNEAQSTVRQVLPSLPEDFRSLVEHTIALQRLSEDVAGLDLSKVFNEKLTNKQLAELRRQQEIAFLDIPKEVRGRVFSALTSQRLPPGKSPESLPEIARQVSESVASDLKAKIEDLDAQIKAQKRASSPRLQMAVKKAEERLEKLQPKVELEPESEPSKVIPGPAPTRLFGATKRQIRKELEPVNLSENIIRQLAEENQVLKGGSGINEENIKSFEQQIGDIKKEGGVAIPSKDIIRQFSNDKRRFREREFMLEEGQDFPTGEKRPVELKPEEVAEKHELVNDKGIVIGELLRQKRALNNLVKKEGVDPTDTSIVLPRKATIERVTNETPSKESLEKAEAVRKALDSIKEIKQKYEIERLTDFIKRNKLIPQDRFNAILQARKILERQIKQLPEKVNDYVHLLQEEQRHFLQGGKGHIRREYIDDINAKTNEILKELGEDAERRVKKRLRIREEHLTKRKEHVDKELLQSPTLPLYNQITNNFNLGAAKGLMKALENTPFVSSEARSNPELRAALESQGWKTLPDSKLYGPLAGATVDPRVYNALEINRSFVENAEGNLNHLNTWMAGNFAARNPSAFIGNAVGAAWQAWVSLGTPFWRIPEILRKGAAAVNHPKWGVEVQSLDLGTLLNKSQGMFVGKIPETLRKTEIGSWVLDDAKRKQFKDYEKELEAFQAANREKEAAQKLWAKSLTDIMDIAGTFARKVMEPVVGRGYATLLDPLKMGEVYGDYEFMIRAGHYVDLRERGWSRAAAERKVKQAFVDNLNVSPVIKDLKSYKFFGLGNKFMNFIMASTANGLHNATNLNPFVTARFWAPVLAFQAVNMLARKQAGETEQDTNKRIALSKSWQGYPNRLFMLEVYDPNTKKINTLEFNRLNPYAYGFNIVTDFISALQGKEGISPTKTTLQAPFAMYPIIEELYNKRLFYGTNIRPDEEKFYRAHNIAATLDHLMESYLPPQYGRNLTTLMRQLRGERSLDKKHLRGIQVKDSDLLVNFLSAIKITEFDKALALEDLGKRLQDIKIEKSKLLRNNYISRDDFPLVTKYLTEDIERQLHRLEGNP